MDSCITELLEVVFEATMIVVKSCVHFILPHQQRPIDPGNTIGEHFLPPNIYYEVMKWYAFTRRSRFYLSS